MVMSAAQTFNPQYEVINLYSGCIIATYDEVIHMHPFDSSLPNLTWVLIYNLTIVGRVRTTIHSSKVSLPWGFTEMET